MSQGGGTRALRDYVPSPPPRVAINLFPELSVGVDLLRRCDWVGEAPHTYFYVNWMAKAQKNFVEMIEFIAVSPAQA
jgi:hypothetical protein